VVVLVQGVPRHASDRQLCGEVHGRGGGGVVLAVGAKVDPVHGAVDGPASHEGVELARRTASGLKVLATTSETVQGVARLA